MKLFKAFIKSFAVWAGILYGLAALIWFFGALVSLDFSVDKLLYWNWTEEQRTAIVFSWFLLSIVTVPRNP
jgi:hypothetical protein